MVNDLKIRTKIIIGFLLTSIISTILSIGVINALGKSNIYALVILMVLSVVVSLILGMVLSSGISKRLGLLMEAADRLAVGDVNLEIHMESNDEIGKLASSLGKMIENIKEQTKVAEMIAVGDLSVTLPVKSENDILAISLNKVNETIKLFITGINGRLIPKIRKGNFQDRARTEILQGEWRDLAEGINGLIISFVEPLKITSDYIGKVANGEELEEIDNTYQGEFKKLFDNLNSMRKSLYILLYETKNLTQFALEGDLSKRADVKRVKGGYADILQGINNTLDAVIEPIEEASQVLDEMSNGNLHVSVKGNYKGDHAIIKEALNHTITAILEHIEETSTVLNEMSRGNLEVAITGKYNGDFIEMKDAINEIINSFNDVFQEINRAAEQVAAGAERVSDSSLTLSQGSTEQASAVEEVTASITEIAAQTKQNAINANNANGLATMARGNALGGSKQMDEMLRAMEEISESSTNISKIIKVIDEIAFQTNILALNAAVEAARAGQQGKGFAVVAEEVRNLAARSANAAKETTGMIEESIKKAENGKNIAIETSQALDKIVDNITNVSEIVANIATASNEQAIGIAQINQAIEEVSQVTQCNTATSEESASSSEELSSQAILLKDNVARFKLKQYRSNY